MARTKKIVRNIEVPVMTLKLGSDTYTVRIAGHKEHLLQEHYQGTYAPRYWSDCSLVDLRHGHGGMQETEMNLYDAGFWAYIQALCERGLSTITDANGHEFQQRVDAIRTRLKAVMFSESEKHLSVTGVHTDGIGTTGQQACVVPAGDAGTGVS